MTKAEIVQDIIDQLSADLDLFLRAAKSAHAAATHEECQPDNKYDTLALESSYVAQGQANRAQEIRESINIYRQLAVATESEVVKLASLVTLEADNGSSRSVFIGPVEGGRKICHDGREIMVITPTSPLGKELLGKSVGDTADIATGAKRIEYEIVDLC
ncbi:GreA/GreB family elongation factor [Geomonas sp. Red875]|uniref:GreA/GreB family elongation factor n=1 Tax=Geomesophilobacter sediminis TaxID=2798584 RepID=A0A8J7LV09_9BACT|nr:GreA/GreB family elongation factor [Geomesophilobacter sediminis]